MNIIPIAKSIFRHPQLLLWKLKRTIPHRSPLSSQNTNVIIHNNEYHVTLLCVSECLYSSDVLCLFSRYISSWIWHWKKLFKRDNSRFTIITATAVRLSVLLTKSFYNIIWRFTISRGSFKGMADWNEALNVYHVFHWLNLIGRRTNWPFYGYGLSF